MKKLIVKTLKPRNPLAAAGRMRRAGVHRPSGGAKRKQAQRLMRREFEALPP